MATRKKPELSPPPTGASVTTEKAKAKKKERRTSTTDSKPATAASEKIPTSPNSESRAESAATGDTSLEKKEKKKEKAPPSAAERQKQLVDAAKAKRAAEAKAELDKLAKIQRELKGKPYIYDRNGEVVVIEETDASKLPSSIVAPGVKVASAAHSDYSDEMMQLKKMMSSSKPARDANGDAEKVRAAAAARAAEQQPSLTETMDMNEGVVLTEGGKTKAGPQRKADAKHMSLKDFQNQKPSGSSKPSAPAAVQEESPPAPDPEPEPAPVMAEASSPNLDGTVPLKDVRRAAKATESQRKEQMGDRLQFPRDRPYVNPTLPTRPIMPDLSTNLSIDQDKSPVGHRKPLPPIDGAETKKILRGPSPVLGKTSQRIQTIDDRLARQLMADPR